MISEGNLKSNGQNKENFKCSFEKILNGYD